MHRGDWPLAMLYRAGWHICEHAKLDALRMSVSQGELPQRHTRIREYRIFSCEGCTSSRLRERTTVSCAGLLRVMHS